MKNVIDLFLLNMHINLTLTGRTYTFWMKWMGTALRDIPDTLHKTHIHFNLLTQNNQKWKKHVLYTLSALRRCCIPMQKLKQSYVVPSLDGGIEQ